ncbi:hypothetical protein FKM82_004955 [Ascaphus truei]
MGDLSLMRFIQETGLKKNSKQILDPLLTSSVPNGLQHAGSQYIGANGTNSRSESEQFATVLLFCQFCTRGS